MSSKLIRGDRTAIQPINWQHVSSVDFIPGEPAGEGPLSGYISRPVSAPGSNTPDWELRVAEAHQKGFEEGRAAGEVAGRKSLGGEVEAMQTKLARAIEELTGLRLRYRREAEQDVVALALAVARRILHRELTVAPEALLGLVKAALERIEAREVHQVRVARSDTHMVRQFFEQIGAPQRIEVTTDPSLAAGSILIESSRGTLDASVDTQLAEIERGFADLVQTT
jgi:flagellar assembly protein FliH